MTGDLPGARRMVRSPAAPISVMSTGPCLPEVPAHAVYDFYAASDLLVFPSLGDNWGLVVSEAFACGLPALCSSLSGCSDDLLRPEENGWTFDPTDPRAFDAALREALNDQYNKYVVRVSNRVLNLLEGTHNKVK